MSSNYESYVRSLAGNQERLTEQNELAKLYGDPNIGRRDILDKKISDYSNNEFVGLIFKIALSNVYIPVDNVNIDLDKWYKENKSDIDSRFAAIREESEGKNVVRIGDGGGYVSFYPNQSTNSVRHNVELGLYYVPNIGESHCDVIRLDIRESLSEKPQKYPYVRLTVDFYDNGNLQIGNEPVIVCGKEINGNEETMESPCDRSVPNVKISRSNLKSRGGVETIRDVLKELFDSTKTKSGGSYRS